jgi:hypothetical protein
MECSAAATSTLLSFSHACGLPTGVVPMGQVLERVLASPGLLVIHVCSELVPPKDPAGPVAAIRCNPLMSLT